ncbi:hypothetical protein [Legionella israelensis]|uniref:Uncharacterized protein n=1 Tax=Legionella israelensis TaxID=454 RepID=A0A0W0VGH5_9GAMM|nr:hypothetical protein [Legionella israelensis]KTD19251.1 hypothetical protein Lisr_2101 [Legionella israelensis]QBS09747.1 hypothetical protein E4T55_07675 [Legionella israelensis]SCY53172.1 hypothetical protein SAMN02746069_02771 [Legionella israelensis DSM 19235]STX59287.1 Uncharacterised protein [Legionella israelensis]
MFALCSKLGLEDEKNKIQEQAEGVAAVTLESIMNSLEPDSGIDSGSELEQDIDEEGDERDAEEEAASIDIKHLVTTLENLNHAINCCVAFELHKTA